MITGDDHDTYTVNALLACDATTWSGDHTCACVYRKTICDGVDHLCMCGSEWSSKITGPYSRCSCPHHEKENTMAHLEVRMTVELGDLEAEVSLKGDIVTRPIPTEEYIHRVSKAATTLLLPAEPSPSDSYDPEGY